MQTFHSAWRTGVFWMAVSALSALGFFSLPVDDMIVHPYVTTYDALKSGDFVGLLNAEWLKALALAMGLLGGLLLASRALLTRVVSAVYASLSQRYELTQDKLIATHGLFSRDIREGFRSDLRTAHLKQSILDRLLGVGDLTLSTLGDQGLRIHLKRVPRPVLLKRDIMHETVVTTPSFARDKKSSKITESQSIDRLPTVASPSLPASTFSEDTALSPFTKPLTQAASKNPTKNPN